jgi:uncharacterized protein YjbI with pentapeptide repeats
MKEELQVLTCPKIPADPTWTPQEQWVWECVQAGEIADFNTTEGYGGQLDPKDPEDWPDTRILRPAFLETVLLHEPYRTAIPRHGLRIVGAWCQDPLDLSHATLACPLGLEQSRFESEVELRALRTPHGFSIGASVFNAPVVMVNMHVESSVNLRRATFAEVDLTGARIEGQLILIQATVSSMLTMNGLHVGGDLVMGEGATFAKVDLRGAQIEGQLNLTQATVSGKLTMNSLHVGQHLFMREGARFAEVDLTAAQIEGQLDLTQATVSGKLDMHSLHVGQGLFMGESRFAEVDLTAADIDGQLNLTQATVSEKLTMNSLHVGQNFIMGEGRFAEVELVGADIDGQLNLAQATVSEKLTMDSLHVGQNFMGDGTFAEVDLTTADIDGYLFLTRATVSEKLTMNGLHVGQNFIMGEGRFAEVELVGAQIEGDLDLTRATVSGKLDLSDAKIDRTLALSGAHLPSLNLTSTRIGRDLLFAEQEPARWQPEAKLCLDNTEVVGMQDAPKASPRIVSLEGFTYSRLAKLTPENTPPRTEHKALRVLLLCWLKRQKQYTPQPYEQLASVLQKTGYKSLATRILFESKKREESQTRHRWSWLVSWLQRMLIGYGYYNFLVLVPVIVFLIVGVAVLHFTGEGRRLHMPYGVSYSVDMLLPIIKLNKKHDEVIPCLIPSVRWYFYFHQIVGYILASFLVAGLAGLTKKNP